MVFKKRYIFPTLLVLGAALLSVLIYSLALDRSKSIDKALKKDLDPSTAVKNILVLGSDSAIPNELSSWKGRSDFILLLSINKIKKAVHLVSIPRDTKISLKKLKVNRINAANAIGGYKASKVAIEKLMGIDIDNVVVFNLLGFKKLIDMIGPVEIYVKKRMYYNDNAGGVHIDIQPGLQKMNSDKLLDFLRFRSGVLGDIGRIKRQHIFFKAVIKEFSKPETIFKVPEILFGKDKLFLSDMDFEEMFELIVFLRTIPSNNLRNYILPGNFGSGKNETYWLVNNNKVGAIVDRMYDTGLEEKPKKKDQNKKE